MYIIYGSCLITESVSYSSNSIYGRTPLQIATGTWATHNSSWLVRSPYLWSTRFYPVAAANIRLQLRETATNRSEALGHTCANHRMLMMSCCPRCRRRCSKQTNAKPLPPSLCRTMILPLRLKERSQFLDVRFYRQCKTLSAPIAEARRPCVASDSSSPVFPLDFRCPSKAEIMALIALLSAGQGN